MLRNILAGLAVLTVCLLHAPVADASPPMVEFNCNDIPAACQNMCWGAYCKNNAGTSLTWDHPSKSTKRARRKAAGCAPNPNRCSTKKEHASGYQCDEYPFASTIKQNGAATRVNRCIKSTQNSKQGATLSKYFRKHCSKTANCDFRITFGNPGATGVTYCETNRNCANDGQEQVGPNNLKRRRDAFEAASSPAMYMLASGRVIAADPGLELNDTVSRIVPINATLYEEQIASHVSPDNDDEDGPDGATDGGDDVDNGDADGDEFDYMMDNLEIIDDPIVAIM